MNDFCIDMAINEDYCFSVSRCLSARVAELVDALDLGSSGQI